MKPWVRRLEWGVEAPEQKAGKRGTAPLFARGPKVDTTYNFPARETGKRKAPRRVYPLIRVRSASANAEATPVALLRASQR